MGIQSWFYRAQHLGSCLLHQFRWLIGAVVIHSIEGFIRILLSPVLQTILQIVALIGGIAYLLILVRNEVFHPIGTIEYGLTNTIDSIKSAIESIANFGASAIAAISGSRKKKISFGDFDLTKEAYADLLKAMPGICSQYTDVFAESRAAWNIAHPRKLCHIARYFEKSDFLSTALSIVVPAEMYDQSSCTITRTASFCFYVSIPYLLMGCLEIILGILLVVAFNELFTDIFITLPTLILLDLEFIVFQTPSKLLAIITLLSPTVSQLSPFSLQPNKLEAHQ